jgi:hypothetical protein
MRRPRRVLARRPAFALTAAVAVVFVRLVVEKRTTRVGNGMSMAASFSARLIVSMTRQRTATTVP